jgi:hypothetical protein
MVRVGGDRPVAPHTIVRPAARLGVGSHVEGR